MMKNNICVIDARSDSSLTNDFLTLNLWGTALCAYVLQTAMKSRLFSQIIYLTDSSYVRHLILPYTRDEYIKVFSDFSEDSLPAAESVFYISARAVMITPDTMRNAYDALAENRTLISAEKTYSYDEQGISCLGKMVSKPINAFHIRNKTALNDSTILYPVSDEEKVVINTTNEFELALVLLRKRNHLSVIEKMIEDRIEEKKDILLHGNPQDIVFVGHSQLDNWDIKTLCGMPVRNCAIRGISDFEYNNRILDKGLLDCTGRFFLIIGGTNDIVYNYSFEEIKKEIESIIHYIRQRTSSPIFYIECLYVNGRLDRNNDNIRAMNHYLWEQLHNTIGWISTGAMGDTFGNLSAEYTSDGLHLNAKGYQMLEEIVSLEIKREIAKNE